MERLIQRPAGWLEYLQVAWRHAGVYRATQRFLSVRLSWMFVCRTSGQSLSRGGIINRAESSHRWEAEEKEGKFLQCIQARCASLLRRREETLPAGIWRAAEDLMNVGTSLRGQNQEQRSFSGFKPPAELLFLIPLHVREKKST